MREDCGAIRGIFVSGCSEGQEAMVAKVATYVETETTSKLEGEMHVGVGRAVGLRRIVHEDWKELVAGDRMKGQECVDYEIDVRLPREYLKIACRRLRLSVYVVFALGCLDCRS